MHSTAAPPPKVLSDTTKIILERRVAELRREIATASKRGNHDRAEQLHMAQAYERRQSLIVAFDNDIAGEQGWRKAWDVSADWTGFQISSDCPVHKDWNDDLIQLASSNLRHA